MSERVFGVAFSLAGALLVAGCQTPSIQFAVAPAVKLDANGVRTAGSSDTALKMAQKGAAFFDIPTSKLAFSPAAGWTDDGSKPPFAMTVTPLDSDVGFYVTPKSKLFQSQAFSTTTTALTVQTLPNTSIPATVSDTVTDNAQQLFQTAAAVAGGLGIKLGAEAKAGGAGTISSFFINLPDKRADLPASSQPVPNNDSGWTYVINVDDPIVGDAIPFKDFQTEVAGDKFVAYFPFPACRALKVTLHSPGNHDYVFYGQAGMPDWVEPITLPANGKITAGSICGGSITPGTVDPLTSLKDISAAITTLKGGSGTTATTAPKSTTPASNSGK